MEDDVLILVDFNGKVWNLVKEVYNKLNFSSTKCGKYSFGRINIKKFNDGEIFEKIEVVLLADLFLEVIYRISHG